MRSLKLVIPGEYWDSQIYAGRLYLFEVDGTLFTINWDRLLADLAIPDEDRLLVELPFRQSDLLYHQILLADPDVRDVLRRKFARLAERKYEVSSDYLVANGIRKENPFPFPHADSAMYYFSLYVVGKRGLHSASVDNESHGVEIGEVERNWDAPVLSTAVGLRALALAAGSEGLWELQTNQWGTPFRRDPTRISAQHASACGWIGWSWQSVYASSPFGGGTLAAYHFEKPDRGVDNPFSPAGRARRAVGSVGADEEDQARSLDKVLDSEEVFGEPGDYSWGARDKLFQTRGRTLEVVRYLARKHSDVHDFRELSEIQLAPWKGEMVAAGSSTFGVIIETEHAIVVKPSVGRAITLPGEPVNWRVFPRSKRYTSHLHVIYEDRLEVHAFTHDYFADQFHKALGTSYWERRPSLHQMTFRR